MGENLSPNGWNHEIKRRRNESRPDLTGLWAAILVIVNLLVKVSLKFSLHFGAGYRIYFGEADNTIVLLLCGGDKSSQNRDIERAKAYWLEYKEAQRSTTTKDRCLSSNGTGRICEHLHLRIIKAVRENLREIESSRRSECHAKQGRDVIANIIAQLPAPQCEISETEKLQAVKT